ELRREATVRLPLEVSTHLRAPSRYAGPLPATVKLVAEFGLVAQALDPKERHRQSYTRLVAAQRTSRAPAVAVTTGGAPSSGRPALRPLREVGRAGAARTARFRGRTAKNGSLIAGRGGDPPGGASAPRSLAVGRPSWRRKRRGREGVRRRRWRRGTSCTS